MVNLDFVTLKFYYQYNRYYDVEMNDINKNINNFKMPLPSFITKKFSLISIFSYFTN